MKQTQVCASWPHSSSYAPLVRAVCLQVGHPVNGTDIIPAFDHSVEMLGDKAILVYPQATGDAGSGAPDEGQGAKYRQVSGAHTFRGLWGGAPDEGQGAKYRQVGGTHTHTNLPTGGGRGLTEPKFACSSRGRVLGWQGAR